MGEAAETESAALRALAPGILVQPRYVSAVSFRAPLELRVSTLWGKARIGNWWWGRRDGNDEAPHRNVWFIRRLCTQMQLSDDDTWETLHEHPGKNTGFDEALRLFQHHIRKAAFIAEGLAQATGAPFLRADFFVGSPQWGLRLNEVAYGSGLEYLTRRTSGGALFDDSLAMAFILQEGMTLCQRQKPAHFLSRLGVDGDSYAELTVRKLSPKDVPSIPALEYLCSQMANDSDDMPQYVPPELCETPPCPASSASCGHSVQLHPSTAQPMSPGRGADIAPHAEVQRSPPWGHRADPALQGPMRRMPSFVEAPVSMASRPAVSAPVRSAPSPLQQARFPVSSAPAVATPAVQPHGQSPVKALSMTRPLCGAVDRKQGRLPQQPNVLPMR